MSDPMKVLIIYADGDAALTRIRPNPVRLQRIVLGNFKGLGPHPDAPIHGWTGFTNARSKYVFHSLNVPATRFLAELGWSDARVDVLLGPVVLLGMGPEGYRDLPVEVEEAARWYWARHATARLHDSLHECAQP